MLQPPYFFNVTIDYLLGNTDYTTAIDKDEERFHEVITDTDLKQRYSELPKFYEEDLRSREKCGTLLKMRTNETPFKM